MVGAISFSPFSVLVIVFLAIFFLRAVRGIAKTKRATGDPYAGLKDWAIQNTPAGSRHLGPYSAGADTPITHGPSSPAMPAFPPTASAPPPSPSEEAKYITLANWDAFVGDPHPRRHLYNVTT